jgi:serine/threonine protein phosphatase PrpC
VSAASLVCPHCQAAVVEQDRYCEGCGADLAIDVPVPDGATGKAAAAETVAPAAVAPVDVSAGGMATAPVGSAAAEGGPVVHVDQRDLAAVPDRCAQCGGDVAVDGYCERCGHPVQPPRDHWAERPASWVAAVCDRGVRHRRNEDAVAVAATEVSGSFAALVVCDGVSSSSGSDVASLAAARTARNLLAGAGRPDPEPPGSGTGETVAAEDDLLGVIDLMAPAGAGRVPSGRRRSRAGSLASRIVDAGLQANAAVAATAGDPPRSNPPSCTFVCALVEDDLLVAGWVGDSRVYWLPDDGHALQITSDDSWAGEAVAAGIPRRDAERTPHAHAITRWFGVDAPDPRPHTAVQYVNSPGWVLVCSDGLWNYCSPAAELQGLVLLTARRAGAGTDPARLAEGLVAWAIEQGGHDNISVALARVQ